MKPHTMITPRGYRMPAPLSALHHAALAQLTSTEPR